jgi:hypothetical protein
MNVSSAKADELAHRLARLTGEDVETAVERAIEERLSRVQTTRPVDRRTAILKFIENVSAMPVKDARCSDEIIGYGPDGLPS